MKPSAIRATSPPDLASGNPAGAPKVQTIAEVSGTLPTLAEVWGSLFASAPVAAWIIDTSGTIIKMEGRAIAEVAPSLIGRSIFDAYADLPHVAEQARRVLRGDSCDFIAHAHGKVWQAFYRPVRDAQGQVTHGYGLAIDITERVDANRDRDLLSERLSFLHRHSGENLWEWDLATGVITSSKPINNREGVHESMADEWIASIHPEDTARVMSSLRRHFEQRETFGTEYRLRDRHGQYRWVTSRGQAEWSAAGQPIRMVGVMSDIDSERCIRLERDEITARHELLVKSSPVGIILWGTDCLVREWNPAATRIFGFSAAEAIGMHANAIVPPPVRPLVDALFRSLLSREGGERSRNENVTKNGRLILCEWYNTTLYNDRDEAIGIAALVEDVTDQARAEALLAERERDLRMITSALPALVAYVDSGLRYRFANQAYKRWFGHSPEQMIGRTIEDVMGSEYARRVEVHIRRALSGQTVRFELEIESMIGLMQMDVVYVPRQGERSVEGFYVLASDITARKKIESELSRYKDHLETLVEERTAQLASAADKLQRSERLAGLGTLAAGLGHDINNLLLPMRCLIDAMAVGISPCPPPEPGILPPVRQALTDQASNLTALRQSLDFLGNLSKSLLILALAPDDVARGHESTNPHEWWSSAANVIQPVLPAGALIKVDVEPGIPLLAIAPAQLTRTVLNLVLNGVEAAGDHAHIRIAISRGPDRRACIAVEDNGPGMPEAVRRYAMDPFFTTKRRGLSTGLGLALVNAVVSTAGGSVQIDESTPRGTRVSLYIPFVARATESVAKRSPRDHTRRAYVSVRDARISAYLLAYLGASGFKAECTPPPDFSEHGSVWIIDRDPTLLKKAKSFASPIQGRRIILTGEPDLLWNEIRATVVVDPADTIAIATALRSQR